MALSRGLFPFLSRDWWDVIDYPSRIQDQHFGVGLTDSDLLPPMYFRGYAIRPRTQLNVASSGSSEVILDKDKFEMMLNVSQFKPEELEVKMIDNYVVIHGKHEERFDEHGLVSREFTRRYMLPQGVEPDTVTSSMSQDGVLTIRAPKKSIEPKPENERVVPISTEQQQ